MCIYYLCLIYIDIYIFFIDTLCNIHLPLQFNLLTNMFLIEWIKYRLHHVSHVFLWPILIAYSTAQRCPHGTKTLWYWGGHSGARFEGEFYMWIISGSAKVDFIFIYLVTWWTVTDLGVGTERSRMVSKKYGIKDFFFVLQWSNQGFFYCFFHEGIGIKVLQKAHEIHSGCLWIIF